MSASANQLPTGANVDGFDRVDATHFYVSFNGNVTIPMPGPTCQSQDEDVVYYNDGTWSLCFDGSVRLAWLANRSRCHQHRRRHAVLLDRQHRRSDRAWRQRRRCRHLPLERRLRITRVIDAIGAGSLGWSTTNVDGVVWVDATHLYLSYTPTRPCPGRQRCRTRTSSTTTPATWSVYFDGTAKGLTSGNLDVDAFDLP